MNCNHSGACLARRLASTLVLEAGSITANVENEGHRFFGPASTGAFASRLLALRTARLPDMARADQPEAGDVYERPAPERSTETLSRKSRQRWRRAAAKSVGPALHASEGDGAAHGSRAFEVGCSPVGPANAGGAGNAP